MSVIIDEKTKASLERIKRSQEQLSANETVQRGQFEAVERTFEELLLAAEGTQQLADLLVDYVNHGLPERNICWLVHSLGKHTQSLRNKAAKELEPIYKAFGADPIGY